MRGRPSKQEAAESFLKTYLSSGRKPALDVFTVGKQHNFGTRTLNRAKHRLGIVSEGETGIWYWRDLSVSEPPTVRSLTKLIEQKMYEFQKMAEQIKQLVQQRKTLQKAV